MCGAILMQYSFISLIRPNGYFPLVLAVPKLLHLASYGIVVNSKSYTFGNSNFVLI